MDEKLLRSDIRADTDTGTVQSGVPLTLAFNVSQLSGSACSFFSGAMMDVWHANALSKYSDISSEGTSGLNFLRGYQLTSSSGVAKFTTIFPGWYSGRAVHIALQSARDDFGLGSRVHLAVVLRRRANDFNLHGVALQHA